MRKRILFFLIEFNPSIDGSVRHAVFIGDACDSPVFRWWFMFWEGCHGCVPYIMFDCIRVRTLFGLLSYGSSYGKVLRESRV